MCVFSSSHFALILIVVDLLFFQALVATNFRWLAFEYLKPYLLMAEQEKRASNVDLWLHIFLACSYAEGDSDMVNCYSYNVAYC